ncbi:MAG TPA: DUF924 family protein [Caulobacteraceae bacterium]|nr:DUF924 family protein [Caulobacteraceae bacterium]
MPADYSPVLEFWFGELKPRQWFAGEAALDEQVRVRFGGQVEAALDGGLEDWAASPRGRLALILLLDQFPRHVFRGAPRAFAGAARAQALTSEGIAEGMDTSLSKAERNFFYIPLTHAEDAGLQALGVEKIADLGDEMALGIARRYRATIERFGRFPHRNAVLGRVSSPQEEAFLTARKKRQAAK